MFGVVCNNEDTGRDEPWTIAGPTDGSTNIVRHECDCDYALLTGIPDQLGAGYPGIAASNLCEKATFNPSTGELKSKCFKGTINKVDVNANSNTNASQPILVQGVETDEDTGVVSLTNTLETTNMNYVADCYLCNDEEGNPVCKPVTCIPTLKVDELLGIEQGATVAETDCNENFNVLFTNCTGESAEIDVSCGCPICYNPSTGALEVLRLKKGINEILLSNDTFSGVHINSNYNSCHGCNQFSQDTWSLVTDKYAASKAQIYGNSRDTFEQVAIVTCEQDVGEAKFALCNDAVKSCSNTVEVLSNSLTLAPKDTTCSASIVIECLPYTATTDTTNYSVTGVDVDGNLRRLDGISYNPTTCALSICNLDAAIKICCYSGRVETDTGYYNFRNCIDYANKNAQYLNITHGKSGDGGFSWTGQTIRLDENGINICSNDDYQVTLTSNCYLFKTPTWCMVCEKDFYCRPENSFYAYDSYCKCWDKYCEIVDIDQREGITICTRDNGCYHRTIGVICDTARCWNAYCDSSNYRNPDIYRMASYYKDPDAGNSTSCGAGIVLQAREDCCFDQNMFRNWSNDYGVSFAAGSWMNTRCGDITALNACMCAFTGITANRRLGSVSLLAWDDYYGTTRGGLKVCRDGSIYTSTDSRTGDDGTWKKFGGLECCNITGLACISSIMASKPDYSEILVRRTSITPFTFTQYCTSQDVTICALSGKVTRFNACESQFSGIARSSTGRPYNLTLWLDCNCSSGIDFAWSSISPIPGTMYGTASSTAINVCGAY